MGYSATEEDFEILIKRIYGKDRLPSYEEALDFLKWATDGYEPTLVSPWRRFCRNNGIHNLYNQEFIATLAEEITKLNSSPLVEICAGDGKLSHHLQIKGIDIVPTDNYSMGYSSGSGIECLSHIESLKKYSPVFVLVSWAPINSGESQDVMSFPTVKYHIRIGDPSVTGAVLQDYDKKGWKVSTLENVGRFSLSAYDVPWQSRFRSLVRFFEKTT